MPFARLPRRGRGGQSRQRKPLDRFGGVGPKLLIPMASG
ncbi:hypothetical protein I546_2642 [Mycobacterium kansasii 732]|nr:hypothetical protein I546_2642 [Mycobacterium kansasii 732]